MINRLFNPVFNGNKTNSTSLALKPYFELPASKKKGDVYQCAELFLLQ